MKKTILTLTVAAMGFASLGQVATTTTNDQSQKLLEVTNQIETSGYYLQKSAEAKTVSRVLYVVGGAFLVGSIFSDDYGTTMLGLGGAFGLGGFIEDCNSTNLLKKAGISLRDAKLKL